MHALVEDANLAPLSWQYLLTAAGAEGPVAQAWQGAELTAVRIVRESRVWNFTVKTAGPVPADVVLTTQELLHPFLGGNGVQITTDGGFDEAAYLAKVLERMSAPVVPVKPGESSGNRVLLGRAIKKSSVTPLRELEEGMGRTVVLGCVMVSDEKVLRNGKKVITFDITDWEDSVAVKVLGDDTPAGLKDALEPGTWVNVRGTVQVSKFAGELELMASDIQTTGDPHPRADTAEEKRIELHLHTKMSAMDSTAEVADAVRLAARFGHPAIAITDHGVVQAFPEAFEAGEKAKVKVILGIEGYLVDGDGAQFDKERPYHFVALVQNPIGLKNLYQLVSESHLNFFYRHPRIPRAMLNKFREGLIVGSACESGELFQAVLAGKLQAEIDEIASFYDYLEIQPLGNNEFLLREGRVATREQLAEFNRIIWETGRRLGLPVVATGDVHFLNPEDSVYRAILMSGQGYSDADHQAPLYYRTTEEMLAEFSYLGEDAARAVVITYPRELVDRCEVIRPIPKTFHGPKIEGAEETIRDMSLQRAQELYGDPLPEIVSQRLDKELHSIITNGFAVLYLIAQKLVKKSMDDGYLVGSRGSVGSSLVATMCAITEVNPLAPHYICRECKYHEFITDGSVGSGADLPDKTCPQCGLPLDKDGHDIPFETFLGFEGDKVPDIDLNFSGEYQPVAHKYTEELFGRGNVFKAGTIATLADRTAYGFVRKYLEEHGRAARNAEINRLVRGCAGVKRTTGQHPGGLMIVPKDVDIHQFSPIQRPANDTASDVVTTHFDYKAISSRLVKLDILGHDDPTVIHMLEEMTGHDPKTVPLDDAPTLSIFSGVEALKVKSEDIGSNVGTIGVPEFGTRFVRQMLEETRPRTFSDLIRISGLSHGENVWLNNAQELIAANTCHIGQVIATRDDIMTFLLYRGLPAKQAFGIMEHVRKGKGLSDDEIKLMRDYDVPEWFVASCGKIRYLFPKAHAVAYVTMAFRIAYFKVHFPLAFYATYFSVRADEFDAALVQGGPVAVRSRIAEIDRKGNEATAREKNIATILEVVLEAMMRGVKFAGVDLYRSDATRFLIAGDDSILIPFASLSGLGAAAARAIVVARADGPFTSSEDLRGRAKVSKSVLDVMREFGTLGDLPETDQMMLF